MDADAFRQLYEYHFTMNRALWDDHAVHLTDEQFARPVAYSHGSVRDQLLHVMDADAAWFGDLSEDTRLVGLDTKVLESRDDIRDCWDDVEAGMRTYLAGLTDEMLFTRPLSGEDANLLLWQVLLHVANHGTDHRAQILRTLHDLGRETSYQDLVFFLYGQHAG